MKKRFALLFVMLAAVFVLSACTDKSKQDADKLTENIVDYTQGKVDNGAKAAAESLQDAFNDAKQYIKENAGQISEIVIEGLSEAAKDVKDEAEDIGGAIKDDLSNNVGEVIDEVKDSIEDAKDDLKDAVDGAKDDVKDAVDGVKDDVKDAVDGTKDDIKDTVDDIKEGADEVVDEVKEQVGDAVEYVKYRFKNYKLLDQHYDKHGKEMGFASREDYEKAASDVINNPAALHKIEAEDGDYVYYIEATNEFVILSTEGYIRTYFLPSAGKKYYDRQ